MFVCVSTIFHHELIIEHKHTLTPSTTATTTTIIMLLLFRLFAISLVIICTTTTITRTEAKKSSHHQMQRLSKLSAKLQQAKFGVEFQEILDNIVIPRSVNTRGHHKVRKYIQRYLHNLGPNWMVTRDTFSKKTPVGRVKFINIIATYVPTRTVCDVAAGGTRNVTAPPRIVLACHYDSIKLNDRGEHIFTGAIDAGVSCASILYLAKFATPYLTRAETFPLDHGAPARPTLQLVFFDGEEPVAAAAAGGAEFKAKDDSLYGSKHLVKMWSQNSAPYTDWFDRSSVTRLGSKRMRNNIQQLSERCLATDADDDDDNEMDNEVGGEEEGEAEDKKSVSAEDDNNVLDNEVVVDDNVELIKLTLARAQRRRRRVQGTLRNKGQKSGAQAGEREMIARQVRRLYSTLDSIQLLILLDLIGGKNPKFYNTTNQGRHFFRLAKIERRVIKTLANNNNNNKKSTARKVGTESRMIMKLLSSPTTTTTSPPRMYFQRSPPFVLSFVRDDHLPFLVRNVPVLHLIPRPFPKVWHRPTDNQDNLNFPAIQRVVLILQVYLLEAFGYRVK